MFSKSKYNDVYLGILLTWSLQDRNYQSVFTTDPLNIEINDVFTDGTDRQVPLKVCSILK
jgi:hypothetical protein